MRKEGGLNGGEKERGRERKVEIEKMRKKRRIERKEEEGWGREERVKKGRKEKKGVSKKREENEGGRNWEGREG